MAPARSRQRLPERVYWFRRGLVAVTAIGLVFAIAHLLGGGGGGSKEPSATQAGSTTSASPSPTHAKPNPSRTTKPVSSASPSGPCALDQVQVRPVTTPAAAGGPITLSLALTTTQPACTFTASPTSLVVKVTTAPVATPSTPSASASASTSASPSSGSTPTSTATARQSRVWSSQDCPASVRTEPLVLRSGVNTPVTVSWNGHFSNKQCSPDAKWAQAGNYQVSAAALGGQPTSVPITLTLPKRPVITKTATPTPTPTPSAAPSRTPTTTPTTKPTTTASAKPKTPKYKR